jgi:lysophospholipase L1-like esterase
VLFTGGTREGPCPVAESMVRLAREIGVPDRACMVETASFNTFENSERSAVLLRQAGAHRLLVVTDRLHMRRAAASFTRLGFEVNRASVPIYEGHVDNSDMLFAAAREAAALAYYGARGWLGPIELRSPATAQGPADNTMTTKTASAPLVIFGASYARGWKPPALAGMPVVNLGVSGQQSFEMLDRFDRDVTPTGARAVVIWGFINDIFRGQNQDEAAIKVRNSYTEMIARARAHGIEPILATEVTIRPSDSWGETIAGLVGWALGKESYQDRINRHVLAVNAWLKDLARKERLLLLDFHSATSDEQGRRRPEFIDKDGSHITQAGYAALTAYATPILEGHFSVR